MLSIIIPIKDEPYINELVKDIHKKIKTKHEIIVVDKSNIPSKIENAKLIKQKSDGLGNAVKEGLEHAKGDIIVIMDGDGSHRPEDIKKLIKGLNKSHVVIGSRFIKGGKTKDITHRKLISLIFRKTVSFILGLDIKDNMSGFSAIKRNVLDNITINPRGYKINLEIMYKAKKKGFKISEVPIVFEKRIAGKSKIGFNLKGLKEVINIIILVLRLKFFNYSHPLAGAEDAVETAPKL